MEQLKIIQLKSFIRQMIFDTRIRPVHISLCLALYKAWMDQGFKERYWISRRTLMLASHIRSIATYHKTIKDLQAFGYFKYTSSFNPRKGSEVTLLNMHSLNANPYYNEQQ